MIYYLIIPSGRNKRKLEIRLKISDELDSSKVVSDIMDRLKDKGLKVHLVHTRAEGPPPEDTKPSGKNMLWCPYCRNWRKFVQSQYGSDRKICEVCSMSTKDFYVQKFNNLWEGVTLSLIKKGRGK